MRQDLVHIWRTWRRQPAFAITAIATLTLGIGANTAIFTVLNAVLLMPVAYPDPDRIVMIGTESGVSAAKFALWREEAMGLQDLTAWDVTSVNLNVGGNGGHANADAETDAEEVTCMRTSANFFRLFGAQVAHGRGFDANDDRPNAGQVVVIGHGFALRHFGSDADVVGRSLTVSGVPHAIVGVLSDRFDASTIAGPFQDPPQIWTPLALDARRSDQTNAFYAAARLAPEATMASTRGALHIVALDFKRRFPGVMPPDDEFGVESLQTYLTGDVRTPLLVLGGAVCFVLLIACANVANLLLVRATARSREMAIRAAIGASRRRLLAQLLTESLALALVSGIAGLLVGSLGVRVLLAIGSGNIPRLDPQGGVVMLDGRIVAFTTMVSIASGLLFGVLPALQALRTDLVALTSPTAARGGASQRGRRVPRTPAQHVLVIAEMTLAVALLIGAALLTRTFVNLSRVDLGFDSGNVLTMRMALRESRFARTESVAALADAGTQRLNAMPGVIASSASYGLPIQGYLTLRFVIPHLPLQAAYHGMGSWAIVSPSYFDVFKIPVRRGRAFTDRDTRNAPPVAIISEAMARQFFSNGDDPLQHQIVLGRGLGKPFDEEPVRQIVGVVGDVRERDLTRVPQPTTYVPLAQQPDGLTAQTSTQGYLTWSLRTRPGVETRAAAMRALTMASEGVPVSHLRSMDTVMSTATSRANFHMLLLSLFAAAAALLAAIGVYGVMTYAIQQRTRELGIRLALGADPRTLRRTILRDGLSLATIGISLGLAMSYVLTRILSGSLFAVSPRDPLIFATVPLFLFAMASIATWLPARLISRLDPTIALRSE